MLSLSCERSAPDVIDNLKVSCIMPDIINDDVKYSSRDVVFSGKGLSYTVRTDENGEAVIPEMVPGIYNITTSWLLSSDEYNAMVAEENHVEPKIKVVIKATVSKKLIIDETPVTLDLASVVQRALMISKIYYSGTKDDMDRNYTTDSYVEIFNNSDETEYLDGKYMALGECESPAVYLAAVEENPELKYRYTTRLSSVANTYLRWKGEYSGVNRMKLVDIKAAEEAEFKEWVKADAGRTARYGGVLEEMETLYKDVARYNLASMYFQEAGLNGAELVPYIGKFEKIVAIYKRKTLNEKAADKEAERLEGLTHQFFNNWDSEIDRKILRNLIFMYYQNVPVYFHSEAMDKYIAEYNGDVDRLTAEIFASSMFTSKERVLDFLSLPAAERNISEKITSDPLYQV